MLARLSRVWLRSHPSLNDRIRSESVIGLDRNHRTPWIGIGDRLASDYAVAIRIYVWETHLGRARRVYDDFERGAQDPGWDARTEDAEQD